MVNIRKHSALLALLTLLSYFFIAQTSIQTRHTHFYPNGIVVTHSHPLQSEGDVPAANHHHSKSEICFFNNLQFQSHFISEPLSIELVSSEIRSEFILKDEILNYSPGLLHVDSRGPPIG